MATTFRAKMTLVHGTNTTYYWENLVLVLVLVSESKGIYLFLQYNNEWMRTNTKF